MHRHTQESLPDPHQVAATELLAAACGIDPRDRVRFRNRTALAPARGIIWLPCSDSCMHICREEVQSVEGQRSVLRAAAKQAEAEAEARFQDEQLRRLEAMPEVERPWTIAALSITPQAAVRPCCELRPPPQKPIAIPRRTP